VSEETPEALAGGPIHWLQQGRTPIGRGPRGVVRLGSAELLDAEEAGKQRVLAAFPSLAPSAPATIERRSSVLLETDLGEPSAERLVPLFPRGVPTPLSGSLSELLGQVEPAGGVNVTPLIRALRRQEAPLPFRPRAAAIQRALAQPLTVTLHRGWAHGAITAARLLSGGICHWRRCGPDRIQQGDLAAVGSLSDPAVALCALKWGWRFDALRAAEALIALGVVAPSGGAITLTAQAHSGLSPRDLTRILGCAPGTVSHRQAATALGRAKGLTIGGVPLRVQASPPVTPRPDLRFRQPRGRDPRLLLDRYHQGVRLDDEARASLTPQRHAEDIARRLPGQSIVDGFCGAGGNAIAFARAGKRVIAIDSSTERLAQARHNASLYGVTDRITFRHGDFFALTPPADACFLDPPWAGGDALLQQAWAAGQQHYRRGMIKLPRSFSVPDEAELRVYLTPEGFPSFVTTEWGLGAR